MKTTNYSFYVWLNDKNTKQQEISTIDAFKLATRLTINYFWGGTILESDWIYTHEDWQIVIEKTLKIEVITDENKTNIDLYIWDLKKTFNQESILVKKSLEDVKFQ